MSLGRKTVSLFLALGFAFSFGSWLALKLAVSPAFEDFERKSSHASLLRVRQALEADLRALGAMNKTYSFWDQAYDYALGRMPEFIDENMEPETWQGVDIDMMMIFDAQGHLLYGRSDGGSSEDEGLSPEEMLGRPLRPGHPLVTHETSSDFTAGLVSTPTGLMQVVSYPILTSTAEGPVAGSYLMGRYITPGAVDDLAKRATAELSLYPLEEADAQLDVTTAAIDSADTYGLTQFEYDAVHARAYQILPDVHGEPAVVIEVSTPRTIAQIGTATMRAALILLAVGSAIFLLAAWLSMRRLIVAPVNQLTRQVLGIRETGELRFEMQSHRSDELGVLAGEFFEMTRSLGQARKELETARDEALSLSSSKSDFLARMSHEIRTPMNGVLGMTELLRGTPLTSQQQRFAGTIYESAESLLEIINDILDFSKIEAGKLRLDPVDVQLREVLQETVEALAGQAHSKGLELLLVMPPELKTSVVVDPVRLRQVLTNLVGNAIKFTRKGEVVVRLSVPGRDADQLEVRFEVADTGIGIKADRIDAIFDSFTQEDGSTTRLYGGTGLGLAISRQLVAMMGGELAVESREGEGSTFSFTLKLEKGSELCPVHSTSRHYLAGKRVLVVDDNDLNREILEHQLTSCKVQTDSVSSAAEALHVLDTAASSGSLHDLAILDMHMPDTDGLALARAIRRHDALRRLKLLILSSVSAPATESLLRELDISTQLSKPIRQVDLYDSLMEVIGDESSESGSRVVETAALEVLSGRVLLAEDNAVNQVVAVGMLESLGLRVTVAANGREAVERAAEESFDAVLMDCQMPIMDGFEATKTIRRMETQADMLRTPIIALTANALKGDRERCLDAGMNEYLTKPFTSEQLHTALAPLCSSTFDQHPTED